MSQAPGTKAVNVRSSERPTAADPSAADHEQIDLQIADNTQVAKPPKEEEESEEGSYDEEEDGEYDDEDEYHDSVSDPQNQPQPAEAAKTAPQAKGDLKGSAARESQLQAAKAAEAQRQKDELLKQKAMQEAKNRQLQQQQQEAEAQKKRLIAEKMQKQQKQNVASRLIGSQEEDDRFSIPGRDSNLGLIKGKGVSPDRPQNAASGELTSMQVEGGQVPTFAQYRQATEFFDMTFKFETLLDSLSEIFRVTSFLEGLLFFIAMIFFFVGTDKSVWYLVLALFHVARSFVGFGMGRLVPSSYDFVEKLEFKGDRPLEYRLVRPELTRKVQTLILEYYDDYEMPARLYTLLALVSLVLDIISFIAVFGLLASFVGDFEDAGSNADISAESASNMGLDLTAAQDLVNGLTTGAVVGEDYYLTLANPYLGRIIVVMLYTMCDVLLICWIVHFRSRVGATERGYVHKALLGFGNNMRIAFGANPKGGRPSAPGNNAAQMRPNDQAKNKQGRGGRTRD